MTDRYYSKNNKPEITVVLTVKGVRIELNLEDVRGLRNQLNMVLNDDPKIYISPYVPSTLWPRPYYDLWCNTNKSVTLSAGSAGGSGSNISGGL